VETDTIILVAESVWYYSPNDEAAFFEWLDKIDCVSKYDGKGTLLNIYLRANAVNEDALRELRALFGRYDIDTKQLAAFEDMQG
jgi:hypothetical protein